MVCPFLGAGCISPILRNVLCLSLAAAVLLWILSPYRPYRVGEGIST
jgi:hypothetical protein